MRRKVSGDGGHIARKSGHRTINNNNSDPNARITQVIFVQFVF